MAYHDAAWSAVLADHEIMAALEHGALRIEPFNPDLVRPASIGLRLGVTAYTLESDGPVDTAHESSYPRWQPRALDDHGRLVILPDEVVLAPTLERLVVPDTMVGVLDGTSEVARLGLSMVLAQQVAPGFGAPHGAVLTLEIVSHLHSPVYLWPGTRLCNLMLLRCGRPVRGYSDMPYNHSDDLDASASRLARHINTVESPTVFETSEMAALNGSGRGAPRRW